MVKIKSMLLLILAFALTLALFSCSDGNCTHVDADADYVCDKCGEELKEEQEYTASLISDGVVNFQIVYAKNAPGDARQAVRYAIVNALKVQSLTVSQVVEGSKEDVPQDCEILIGDITTRDAKYHTKGHNYGSDGYVIKVVDSKVIINAGSSASLVAAIEMFAEAVFGYEAEDGIDLSNVTVSSSQNKEVVQTDYKITSISVRRKNIKDYTIATDTKNAVYMEAAEDLQYMLYDRAGLWLEIVDLAAATDKSIVIKHIDKVYTDDSFKVYTTESGQLVIECAFDNLLKDTLAEFLTNNITAATGNIVFNGTLMKKDISTVYYEDFGAKGDGKTDDFVAIYNTHVFANEGGQRVMADSTKTYYIHRTRIGFNEATTIPVKTNVEWGTAKFIIDDSDIDPRNPNYSMMYNWHIFTVVSDYEVEEIGSTSGAPNSVDKAILDNIIANGGIKPGTTNIDLGSAKGDYPVMIFPSNYGHRVFRRHGPYTPATDGAMRELIVLDKDGNVSAETPIMFDYTSIQTIEIYRIDDTPITINGGIFTTVAYELNSIDINTGKEYVKYFKRGISVKRSNVTVQNVEHYMENEVSLREQALEGKWGPAYTGFYCVEYSSNVLFKDCIMTAKRDYGSGTYEIAAAYSNKVVFDGCVQTNFWIKIDEDYNIHNAYEGEEGAIPNYGYNFKVEGVNVLYVLWGCGGSNYCKNMEYINSRLSRFDAHMGLYNGKIINSEVSGIEITGFGDMIIENSRLFSNASASFNQIMMLRADYGYTWNGEITIKDTDVYFYTKEDGRNPCWQPFVFNNGWSNWYFGYNTYTPNLVFDNLDLFDMHKITPKHNNGKPLPVGANISSEVLKSERIDEENFELILFNLPNAKAHLTDTGSALANAIIQLTDRDEYGNHYDLSDAKQRAKYEALLEIYNSLTEEEKKNYNGIDGLVDDPTDRTKPLVLNGETLNYLDTFDDLWEKDKAGAIATRAYRYTISGDTRNLNIRIPPEYVKILNNDGFEGMGGYVFSVPQTAGQEIPNGEHFGIAENNGGYFGCTTFYYEDKNGQMQSFVGTFENKGPYIFVE